MGWNFHKPNMLGWLEKIMKPNPIRPMDTHNSNLRILFLPHGYVLNLCFFPHSNKLILSPLKASLQIWSLAVAMREPPRSADHNLLSSLMCLGHKAFITHQEASSSVSYIPNQSRTHSVGIWKLFWLKWSLLNSDWRILGFMYFDG